MRRKQGQIVHRSGEVGSNGNIVKENETERQREIENERERGQGRLKTNL